MDLVSIRTLQVLVLCLPLMLSGDSYGDEFAKVQEQANEAKSAESESSKSEVFSDIFDVEKTMKELKEKIKQDVEESMQARENRLDREDASETSSESSSEAIDIEELKNEIEELNRTREDLLVRKDSWTFTVEGQTTTHTVVHGVVELSWWSSLLILSLVGLGIVILGGGAIGLLMLMRKMASRNDSDSADSS